MFASARKTRSCNDTPHSRPGLATFCFHNRWNNNTNAYLRNSYRPRKESYVTRSTPVQQTEVQVFQYLPFESRERIAERLLGSFFSSSPILSFLLFFLSLSLSFSLSFSPLFFNDSHGMINDSIMFRGTKVNSQPFTAGEKHAGCTKDGQLLYPWLCFSSTFTVVMDLVFLYDVYTG